MSEAILTSLEELAPQDDRLGVSEAILTSLEELAPQDDRLGVSEAILTSLEELAPQDDRLGGGALGLRYAGQVVTQGRQGRLVGSDPSIPHAFGGVQSG